MKNLWVKTGKFATIAAMLICGGCVSEMPSDITLDELERKMAMAMDPQHDYRHAESYYQRQNITEEGFFSTSHQLVEVRFQRPDKFKFSYYEKNQIVTELLCIGNQAWMIDYRNATVNELSKEALGKLKIMLELGHPDTDYDKLFASVNLTVTEIDDQSYYKLYCIPAIPGSNPIIILVDKATYLPRRLELAVNTPSGKVESVSEIKEYQQFGTVYLPGLTQVTEGSREFDTRLVGYQLNAHFDHDEFSLPTFDPVLMEVRRRNE